MQNVNKKMVTGGWRYCAERGGSLKWSTGNWKDWELKYKLLTLCALLIAPFWFYLSGKILSKSQHLFFPSLSCLDYLKQGISLCGIYKLFDSSGNSFPAYCDFHSEHGTAWTLVMSWSHAHRALPSIGKTPFKYNAPVNENAQNWKLYRLGLSRMKSLQSHSTHWRATCGYPTYGVDFRDYVRGNFSDFDVVDYLGSGECKKVEFVNIRGHIGIHVTASFWQRTGYSVAHINSPSTECAFNPSSGATSSEDNFGSHKDFNTLFRCTKNDESTTQWWFGGHLWGACQLQSELKISQSGIGRRNS